MPSGTVHNVHIGKGVVLYDRCERCEEHARHPFYSLDDSNLRKLSEISKLDEWPLEVGELDWRAANEIRSVRQKADRLLKLGVF